MSRTECKLSGVWRWNPSDKQAKLNLCIMPLFIYVRGATALQRNDIGNSSRKRFITREIPEELRRTFAEKIVFASPAYIHNVFVCCTAMSWLKSEAPVETRILRRRSYSLLNPITIFDKDDITARSSAYLERLQPPLKRMRRKRLGQTTGFVGRKRERVI